MEEKRETGGHTERGRERGREMWRQTECKLVSACSVSQAHSREARAREKRENQRGELVLEPAVPSLRRRVPLCSHTVLFPFPVLSFTVPSTARAASLALQGRASSMARSPNGFFSFQPSLRDPVADCRLNYSHVR